MRYLKPCFVCNMIEYNSVRWCVPILYKHMQRLIALGASIPYDWALKLSSHPSHKL